MFRRNPSIFPYPHVFVMMFFWVASTWDVSKFHRVRNGQIKPPDMDTIDKDFLTDKLDDLQLGDAAMAGSTLPDAATAYCKIYGFVVVSFSHSSAAGLKPHSLEWRYMEHLYGNQMSNMLYFKVESSSCLSQPVRMIHMGGRGNDSSNREFIVALTPETVRELVISRDIHGVLMSDAIESAASANGLHLPPPVITSAMCLPYPLSILVTHSEWHHLAFPRCLRCAKESHYRDDWKSFPQGVCLSESSLEDIRRTCGIDRALFLNMADSLREWAPVLTSVRVGGEVNKAKLEEYIRYLDNLASSLVPEAFTDFACVSRKFQRGGYWNAETGVRVRYTSLYLIQVLAFSFGCRNQSGCMTSLGGDSMFRRALNLLPDIAQQFLTHLHVQAVTPSRSTVCRCRLFVDVAFMRLKCERHAEFAKSDGVAFGLLDSSPQGGRNWLMIEVFYINGADLSSSFQATEKMFALRSRGILDEVGIEEFIELAAHIKQALHHHVFPLTAMGSRHASFSHKAHAWLHTHRLESFSFADLKLLAASYFSFAIDRGPEKSTTTIFCRPEATFPHWIDMTITPDAQADQEGAEAAQPRVSLKHTFNFPGPFHLLDNIQKRLLDRLPGWKDHKSGLEASASYFHAGYIRDAFMQTHLIGERFAWRPLFASGPPKFEGGRVWGVVVDECDWFLPRQSILAACCSSPRVVGQQDWVSAHTTP
jgi:hypothetical protein